MDSNQNSRSLRPEANSKPTVQSSQQFDRDEEKWDLGWLAAALRRQAGLIGAVTAGTTIVASGLLFWMAGSLPRKYSGGFQLLVEPVTVEEQQVRSSATAQRPESVGQINIEDSQLDYETQIRVLKGPKLIEPIVKLAQTRYPDLTYDSLIANLEIARVNTLTLDKKERSTKLIEVSYQDDDPQKVEFVLQQLSKVYLAYSLKERQSSIRQGVKFIDTQLPKLRQRVDGLQRQIQALRQQYTIVTPELQGEQLTTRAGNLGQQKADSQTQIAEAQAKYNALQQQLKSSNLQSVLGEAPYYQSLLTQYQQIEGQLATESARLQPDNPALQALIEKRKNLQNLLLTEADRVLSKASGSVAVAEARDRAIAQSRDGVNQSIQQLTEVSRKYADLQRELTLATESLNKFSSRREALQIDVAQQEVPWELIAPPKLVQTAAGVPQNVAAISKVRFLAVIVVLSLLLGVGVGLLAELSQDVLQTKDEAKRFAKLPLLGAIPLQNAKDASIEIPPRLLPKKRDVGELSRANSTYSLSIFDEAFRSIYKNVRLSTSVNNPIRSLAVSSAETGEGKTTIAVNLALAAAAMGQRVLLVDADLRYPQVHEQIGVPNRLGLGEIISSNVNAKVALQQSSQRDNLMVLTAGQIMVDPTEILTSDKMRLLMEQFQMVFDLIIYDTPPVVGLADASLIAAQTDGLVMVVRLGKTKRSAVTQALEELSLSSGNVLGLVANGVKNASVPYAYHDRAKA